MGLGAAKGRGLQPSDLENYAPPLPADFRPLLTKHSVFPAKKTGEKKPWSGLHTLWTLGAAKGRGLQPSDIKIGSGVY